MTETLWSLVHSRYLSFCEKVRQGQMATSLMLAIVQKITEIDSPWLTARYPSNVFDQDRKEDLLRDASSLCIG